MIYELRNLSRLIKSHLKDYNKLMQKRDILIVKSSSTVSINLLINDVQIEINRLRIQRNKILKKINNQVA